uniref:Uncharacterized protein n=1 Tax=Oryza sativa subsp. japonica TaxID=39947 RepID=Q7XI17_ORYSJ|nr:hypothetical protein [Oryza sativa Japonica Group]
MGRPNTVSFGPRKENIYNHQSQEAKRGKIIPAAQVTNFIRRNNVGFGRSIGRKGAPHTIPHGLHGLGRSSNLTLAREGLVGGWHEALRLNLPKPVAKAMEQERREAKSRTSALPGQRRLRRRVQGEDYLPKEDDFAMASSPPRGPRKPFRPIKPKGYRAGDRQMAHQGPMSPYNIMYPCKCPFRKGNHVNSPVQPKP